jgi:hypothetical protein
MMTWYQDTYSPERLQALHEAVLRPALTREEMTILLPERMKMLDEIRAHVGAMV